MDLRGTQGADTLVGGAESDVIYGFGGADTLRGGAGDDVIAGNDGNDLLQGGDGDDYLLGGPGNDTIDGGAGGDWAAYEDATAGVKVDLNLTGPQNTGGGGTDRLTSIEHVYGSAFNDTLIGNAGDNMMVGGDGSDSLTGGKGDDTLWGSAGNDTLDGGDGDDWLVGGAGDDVIKGGAGVDWASYEDATAGVTVDLAKTTAQDTTGAGMDTLNGVERLWGSRFADVLTGDAQNNYLWGEAGDDKLYGGAGDDHLSGGAGVNVINGGDGFDTVDYAFSDVGVTINLSGAPAPQIPIPDGVDTLVSIEAAMGSAHNDYIVGNDAENYLFGDAGDDVLFGIGGHDTLDGGEGNEVLRGSFRKPGDLMLGGAGRDQIIVWTGAGSEGAATIVDGGTGVDDLMFSSLVDITLDLSKTGDQEIAPGVHMVVSNIENVTGGYGNDRLTGDAGDNIINGGAGDDVLSGGGGFNVIDGGDGFDTVDFSDADQGVSAFLPGLMVPADGQWGRDYLFSIEAVIGSGHDDWIYSNTADNYLYGGAGDDVIYGMGGRETMDGGEGNDTLVTAGNSPGDMLLGGAGDDLFIVGSGTNTIDGGDGVDTLWASTFKGVNIDLRIAGDQEIATGFHVTLSGVENLIGSDESDTLIGNAQDNVLEGRGGVNALDGDDGFDIVSYERAPGGVRVDLSKANAAQGTGISIDTLKNFEGVKGSRYIDVLIGDARDNTFEGGAGNDIINGGAGKDTAIYQGVSSDYSWRYNSNGTVTMSGPDGTDTLLNVEVLKFADTSVTLASNGTTLTADDLIATKVLNSVGEHRETVLSADGRVVYVNAMDGYVTALDVATGQERGRWKVGTSLQSLDVSADGKLLVATDFQTSNASAVVHVLDLVTGAVKDYVMPLSGNAGAFRDAAFDISGKVILSQAADTSASIALTILDPTTGVFTTGTKLYPQGADLTVSQDHTRILLVSNSADGASFHMLGAGGVELATYQATPLTGMGGYIPSTQAISKDGALFAQRTDSGDITLYDSALHTSVKLEFGFWGGFIGMDFSADGKYLYVVGSGASGSIYQFSASTGALKQVYLTGAYVSPSLNVPDNGVEVSADGSRMIISSELSLVSINLANLTPEPGNDAPNLLIGTDVLDDLRGYGGDDVLVAGKGGGGMSGGQGSDTFVFKQGASPWTAFWGSDFNSGAYGISDWEAKDRLQFGTHSDEIRFEKVVVSDPYATIYTVGDTAARAMAEHNLTYLVVGSALGVFVFASGEKNGGIESVVRLYGAGNSSAFDKISIDNFVIGGDDRANVLTGGALNDTIRGWVGDDTLNGGAGDDVLYGGRGADTLTGGAGADVFKFLAGDGSFNTRLLNYDTVTDFAPGDKLAFAGAPAVVKEADILRLNNVGVSNGGVDAASALTIEAYNWQLQTGGLAQKYLIVSAGFDTYVVADTDNVLGYDQVVLLKNVASSLVTADMFTGV